MKRLILTLIFSLALWAPATASADFGLNGLSASFTDETSAPEARSGAHPAKNTTIFNLNTYIDSNTALTKVDGGLRDLHVSLPAGFAGNARAMAKCEMADFLSGSPSGVGRSTACPNETVVGYLQARVSGGIGIVGTEIDPLYNLLPDPGAAAKFGAFVGGEPQLIEIALNPDPPHNLIASITNTTQLVEIRGSDTVIWGNPASSDNDQARGPCAVTDTDSNDNPFDDDVCESDAPEVAYLTMPRSCTGPLSTGFGALAWWSIDESRDPTDPDPTPATFSEAVTSPAMSDCQALDFDPDVSGAPSTNRASSPSGFEFGIEIDDPGLVDPDGRADSDLKQAVVTLPEGMTVNAAAAGGLGACTEAQLAKETPSSDFGTGCPAASRVASVDVDSPLLDEHISGSIFLATPYTNPLGELLAGYLVLKQPERGVVVRLAGKIETDPNTGQITASFDQNPQLPFSDLEVNFFAGPRAPLTTPDTCGDYEVHTALHPWSGKAPDISTQQFEITQAAGGGACPRSQADLPHSPDFEAGTVRPVAGAHSPFILNLRRQDGEQRFSEVTVKPPAGLTAKLAGTPYCSEAALARAEDRSGKAEQAGPSCPAASEVGRVWAATGSGPAPYWAPGKAYLSGPYKGAPLSMAIITPAVAGPFDLGTVVIRTALHVDQRTAEITAVSDPIPERLEGIPLDIRTASVRLNKPGFTLNPTSCDPKQITGELTSTQGKKAGLQERFQVGECARLGFKPNFRMINMGKGRRSTLRSFNPPMRFVLAPRPGDANMGPTQVVLPPEVILDQGNIRTICTRAQFASDSCPERAIYGSATAWTPLLDEPLTGPVYLGSSTNPLPDIIVDLEGQVPVVLQGRIDTVKGARMRNSFPVVPDAPVSRFVLDIQGGANRGILVNSKDLCRTPNRGVARFQAQNNRLSVQRPRIGLRYRGCKRAIKQQLKKKALRKRQARRAAKRRAAQRQANTRRAVRR